MKENKCWCECKKLLKLHLCKENYIWNPSTGTCKCEYLNNYTKHLKNKLASTGLTFMRI